MSYKVFITASQECSKFIFDGVLRGGHSGMLEQGPVDTDPRIPSMYHNRGFYYCMFETENVQIPEKYTLTVC